MAWMCLILLNIHLFSWILVMIMFLSLRAVVTCTLLYFPVSCWFDMAYKHFWTVVGYFLWIPRIQKLFLFIYGNAWFHGLLFVDWDIYKNLWFSQFFFTMPMVVPLGGKLKLTSNISYLMKGWSDRSILML